MVEPKTLLKATFETGRELLRAGRVAQGPSLGRPTIVPVRTLGENHRSRIAAHLIQLSEEDRYLRFGYVAKDEQIRSYVAMLNFERDEIFGVYNRRLELIAVAHLAYSVNPLKEGVAEFGVSVSQRARGKGLGARLFERAAMHATNDGIAILYIQALSENTAMLTIARNAGATVERDGAESEAFLRLAPPTMETHLGEMLEEHIAQTDYQIKVQARLFWKLMSEMQDLAGGNKSTSNQPETIADDQ